MEVSNLNKYQRAINQIARNHIEKAYPSEIFGNAKELFFKDTRRQSRRKLKEAAKKYGYKNLKLSTLIKIKDYGKDHKFKEVS